MIPAAALSLILNAAQVYWLNIAYNEGALYGLPKYTQAIILVESSACMHKRGDDGHSLGCGQLQVATARLICRCKISRDTLTHNNLANIRISAAYLSACFERFWPDKRRAEFCFNRGIPAASKATAREIAESASQELDRDDPRWKPHYIWRVESAVRALEGVKQNHE